MKKNDGFDENEPFLEDGVLSEEAWQLPHAPEGLRGDVLARTTTAVRARGKRRRTLFAGAIAAAYAGGVLTAFLALGGLSANEARAPMVSQETQEEHGPEPTPEHPAAAPDAVRDPEQFALLLAHSPHDEKIRLLKATGDRYLNEFGDVELAMNYYRRLLALEPSGADAQPNLDDTWLLRSLKQARLQEESHENANS